MGYYITEQEIATVVEGFEHCTTTKEELTHLSHLTVATYYLCDSTPEESFQKMRFGLLRFLDHHGVNPAKYSDSVTLAWIENIREVREGMDDDSSLLEIVNKIIARLGHSRLKIEGSREVGKVNE
jgi:hypothetical protein